ncbi:hypothetical protein [Nostoc sp.]|uniref:hypothetical protein n=1 Tax=Nostoc sp. TaxID=1180 RepID=UPI002FF595E3
MTFTRARSLVWQAIRQTITENITAMFLTKKKVQGFLLILALALSAVVGLSMR